MLPYRIADIRPKSGILAYVHHSMLNRACQILSMDIGKRGWFLVDVGDGEFGPHRISISHISSICIDHENHEIRIETEKHLSASKGEIAYVYSSAKYYDYPSKKPSGERAHYTRYIR